MRYTTALFVVQTSRIVTLWHSKQVRRNILENYAFRGSHRPSQNRPPVDGQTSFDRGADRIISHLVKLMFWVRISSTFSVLRLAYFDLCTSTFSQIWTSYWSRTTGRSTVLVEVKSVGRRKGRRYENGGSTEKIELMRTPCFSP